jgi:formylglycine-generating enzyme required for sulfatase activity
VAYQSHYEKSYALVIGIDAYQALPPLETAVHGAETVARILEENLGFEVTLLRDAEATRDAILAHLSQEFADTQPDDRLLVYFAGHGLTRRTTTGGEVGFLAPYGVEVGKYHQAIEMEYLVDRSKFFPAKHTLFVLDACFSGLAVTRASVSERLLEDLMTRRAVQAIAAGQQDQEVADRWGPAGHSIFTGLLLDRLEQRGGLLTGNELGLHLQRQVGMYTKSRQTPHYGQLLGSQGGDFVFWAEEIVVELPTELRAAIESPLAGVREGAVRELAHLLEGSMPEMAQRAHEALERLAEDDSRSVSTAALEALGTPPAAPVEVAPPPEAPPAVPEVVREEPPGVEPAPAAPPAPVEEARAAAPAPRERPKRTGLLVGGLGAVAVVAVGVALATGALAGSPAAPAEEEAAPTAEEEAAPVAEEAAAPTAEKEAALTAEEEFMDVTANDEWTPELQEFDGVEMVLVPPGCFMMGSTEDDIDYAVQLCEAVLGELCTRTWFEDESPLHEVCFDEPFWIDVYEVTNTQYGSSGEWSGDNLPRESVSWSDAAAHCEDRGARLPTEAEWEYAARGPDGLVFPWGNDFVADNVVYSGNSGNRTREVGSKPGGISWVGAYDLSGNVWEWVNDWYGPYPGEAQVNPAGPGDGEYRARRGGAWITYSYVVRAAVRSDNVPSKEDHIGGFRCARSY